MGEVQSDNTRDNSDDSDMRQIETILSVSHCPRWQRQVQSRVAVADGFANKQRQCKRSFSFEAKVLPSF